MKQTTQKIQNLLNQISQKISIIKDKMEKGEINGNVLHQELSLRDAVDNLIKYLDIFNQTIDYIDKLSFPQRNSILQYLTQINNSIVGSTINNTNQFIQNVDYLNNYIHVYSLEKIAPDYPNFSNKLSQLNQLIEKEKELITLFEQYQEKFKIFDEKYKKTINYIKEIEDSSQRITNLLDQARTNLNEINTNKTNIDNIFEEIREIKTTSQNYLDEVESQKNKIDKIKEEIDTYIAIVEETERGFKQKVKNFESEIEKFKQDTQEIIKRNQEYQNQIEKILTSAVGTNLFKSFEIRKNELQGGLRWWLGGVIIFSLLLAGLGWWIYEDIKSEHIEWTRTLLKIAVSFPILYLLVFFTNRYSKDKQLLEEYAFKSSLSLALKPYAELVDEVEKNKADSKYRDFLITSILQIFSSPTDKLYKHYKSEGLDIKEIIKSLNIFGNKNSDA